MACRASPKESLDEEIAELKEALVSGTTKDISSEIGDLLFTIVQVARWKKIDAEESLREMLTRFTNRFQQMEELAAKQGTKLEEMNINEMDTLWLQAKTLERAGEYNA